MPGLMDLIPDAETLLALAPEEIAFYVLKVASTTMQNRMCNPQYVLNTTGNYAAYRLNDVQVAVLEAWAWLENQLYLVPAPGPAGAQGWRVLGRRAKGITDAKQWNAIRAAAAFPKELLHASIAERAWILLMRSELDLAVPFAFRTVEEAVRAAGGFVDTDIGVDLVRRAFHPDTGPLTDQSQPVAERQALRELFAGAIGSYKNPHSHRTVAIRDAAEAQEMVMLASTCCVSWTRVGPREVEARGRVRP